MSEEKPRTTEAQKRAKRKYMEKFVEIKVRMTPERRSAVQAHAEAQGESTTGFLNRAIDESMERDNAAPGAAGGVRRFTSPLHRTSRRYPWSREAHSAGCGPRGNYG